MTNKVKKSGMSGLTHENKIKIHSFLGAEILPGVQEST
jgi:hypothetical protein